MAAESTPHLHSLLFVLNPISGDIDKQNLESTITAFCTQRGRQAAFFHTSGENDLDKLRAHLAANAYNAVFAAGGDGTVNLVGEALLGGKIPLGILPLGSGNGLSKDLGIPQDMGGALEVIWKHKLRALDTLHVGGHFSAHLADLGFNALVVERFCSGDKRGPGAYIRIALQEYLSYEPVTYHIETDREQFEGPAFMLTIANANTFGSNVVINPDSHLDDGEFELCLIEPFPATAALGILYHLYTDAFDTSVYTKRLRCRRASIQVMGQPRVLVQVDGEPLTLDTPIEVKINPRSLQVLTPAPY
ncbi:diacylglycerol kinase catalytic region [Hymenobacter roseosalivarius DSM 11622]|uniref:Diacylglycerol kinase catalytic region n=1 Tax=Hymenobacter roseosalivarius DSM 11622 TaxID=645990 RepID=A0A1W1W2W1_9BACT|nr:diacylglycerol kinase family protein [Hymenobacter roseosalivarius]SMB99959.1 diacylglycerol kinase catalytic region [Hymenobacter roseosalivarius DSM 11622]